VTWANQPPTVGTAATTSSGSGSGYRTWNVASMVAAMYSTSEHNGFLIRDANENQDSEQQYHSREKGSDLPQLVLEFQPAAAPPPPPPGDTTPPDTRIEQGPSNSTTDTSAQLNFEAIGETGTTFECRLDSDQASAFANCTSPKNYTGLALGSHRFEVRAVDAAGNKDQTPALWTWTVTSEANDTTPPLTNIDQGPPATTEARTAEFRFSANETGSTFECKLDTGDFGSCTSPTTLLGLSIGAHTFQVRAKDVAGNVDDSPATYAWTIQAPNCGSAQTVGSNQDAWIVQNDPTKNNGGDSILKVMSKSGNSNMRALIRYNLPTAPAGCVLDTAVMRLYAGGYKENRTIEVIRADVAWTEGGVNWSNQPGTAGTAATTASGSSAGWREWNVAAMVEAQYSGTNNGFLVRDASENQDAEQQYNSKEKGSDTPQLVLTFKPAP
jgi:hypothetical protein